MIAKVVLPLAINTAFDYYIPEHLERPISKGMRVKVPFRNSQAVGYVIGFSKDSDIKGLKSILSLLDSEPILDNSSFRLVEYIASNYLCSLGQAIDTMLPTLIRKGRNIDDSSLRTQPMPERECLNERRTIDKGEVVLLHDLINQRWDIFQNKIEYAINNNKGIIVLSPEINSSLRIKKLIEEKFKAKVAFLHSKNTDKQELEEWLKLKNGDVRIVVGTSFAVFAPVKNLGLIIIDEEDNTVYKQKQSPYYNSKSVALFRIKQSKANLILASFAPSLESYYLAKRGRYKLHILSDIKKNKACVQIVDICDEYRRQRRSNVIISGILENAIRKALMDKAKVLLFLNRVGFATYATCNSCGFVLRCSRCSKNLIFMFEKKQLLCRWCNFKMPTPKACPECGLSYIRYLGLGTEKLESEVHRLFPQSRILRYDRLSVQPKRSHPFSRGALGKEDVDLDRQPYDILIATQIITKDLYKLKKIDLLGVISLDMSLDRVDFRAAERTYQLISPLISVAKSRVIIQTRIGQHYIIKPLINSDFPLFYKQELAQRRELSFPPLSSLALINLRGRSQGKVELAAEDLFQRLKRKNDRSNSIKYKRTTKKPIRKRQVKMIEVFNPTPAMPLKLRGNFRYSILLRSKFKDRLINFLNKNLRDLKKSGTIITADIDPL